MGNYQTNLKIDQYFEEPLVDSPNPEPIEIIVHLDPPAVRKDDSKVDKVKLRWFGSKLNLVSSWSSDKSSNDTNAEKYIHWSPKSHIRDFEVIDEFTVNEIKIARGQGIGVIIIEQFSCYTKLIYDRDHEDGVNIPAHTIWHHGEECKKLLAADLNLGYDVLFINKDRTDHLCEKKDQRDEEKTTILFSSLKPYAKYDHNEKKIKVSTVPLTESEEEFLHVYKELIKSTLGEGGIYPHHVVSETDQKTIQFGIITKTSPIEIWRRSMNTWKTDSGFGKVVQMVFGMDRTTKPNQGTLYDDCLPFIYANRTDGDLKLKVGVINYDMKRIGTKIDPVDEKIDWENPFWTSLLIKEWVKMNKMF